MVLVKFIANGPIPSAMAWFFGVSLLPTGSFSSPVAQHPAGSSLRFVPLPTLGASKNARKAANACCWMLLP